VKDFYRRYMARDGYNVSWDLIRGAWSSVAMFALGPMQDFLSLNNEARMNYPGNPSGNWTWRMPESAMNESLQRRIWETNWLYGRLRPEIKAELKEQKKKAAAAAAAAKAAAAKNSR